MTDDEVIDLTDHGSHLWPCPCYWRPLDECVCDLIASLADVAERLDVAWRV